MNGLFRLNHAGGSCVWTGAKRSALAYFHECGRHIVKCDSAESVPLPEVQHAELGIADAGCVCQHGLEHGFELAGRAADDTEDLGGRRLLLQRFAQLIEQARVLDGDDGLIGEACQKSDVILLERAHLGPANYDSAERTTFPYQGHAEGGPMSIL